MISGPAGSGKSSLAEGLIEASDGEAVRAITATTRAPRPGEVDGKDYHFYARERFLADIAAKKFVEFNEFNGNYYGTPKAVLDELLEQDKVVVLVIDVNGATEIRKLFPHAVLIFILPPTLETLRKRLCDRGTECPADVEGRLAIAEREVRYITEYDHLIINDELDAAIMEIYAITNLARAHHIRGGELDAWHKGLYEGWHRQPLH